MSDCRAWGVRSFRFSRYRSPDAGRSAEMQRFGVRIKSVTESIFRLAGASGSGHSLLLMLARTRHTLLGDPIFVGTSKYGDDVDRVSSLGASH